MWRDAGEERSLFFLDHITHRLCALMPTAVVKPALTRTRSRPVATELEDASSTLLLLTLAPPHGPTSHPPSRRKSIEDLRVPPTFHPTGTTSPVKRNTNGKTTLEPGPRLDLRLLGPYGERRKEVEREPGIGVNVMGGGLHPFAGTSTLLRRCVSELDLGDGDDQDEDDESDFASDEEPFHLRTPSIRSVSSSTRGSRFIVGLEDRSSQETTCFATDATIKGFYSVGEKAGGFVVFDCEIQTREGPIIRTLKRYSAFVRLRSDLLRAFPALVIPRLPPKSSLAKFRQSFLERRRQQLSFWLTTVLLHPETGGCGLVRSWITEP